MDPHFQPYADNNLNEKSADTSYIYNTEATYVTTVTREQTMPQHIDVNQQWGSDAQNMQYQDPNQGFVQGVDPQYQQNVVVTEDNQSYILQQDPNTPYITQHETVETHNQQVYTMAQDGHQTTYVYQEAHVQETFDGQVSTETQYVHQEYAEVPTNPSEERQDQLPSTTEVQITEIPENDPVPPSEIVEPTDGIVVSVSTPDEVLPLEDDSQGTVNDSSVIEVSEVADESQVEGAEEIEDEIMQVVEEDTEDTADVPMETHSTDDLEQVNTKIINEAEPTVPTEPSNDTENVIDDPMPVTEIQEDTKQVQNEITNESKAIEISEGNAESVQDENVVNTAQVQSDVKGSMELVPETTSQLKHTPEQALGAMYEFSEESEGHINISVRNQTEQIKSNDSSYSEVENERSLLDEDQAEPENSSIVSEATDDKNSVPPLKPRRGRKTKGEVPSHVLGIDISKPVENLPNGKAPKPRLGVKVPTRNLTSHIVSKEEIEREIVERGRRKMESKAQEAFAKKLTQRLAKQIAGDSLDSSAESSSNNTETQQNRVMIENNSDLLAILEGDDDDSSAITTSQKDGQPRDAEEMKNLEREIALQQLKELPFMSPKTKDDTFKIITGVSKDLRPPKVQTDPKKLSSTKKKQHDVSSIESSSSPTKSELNPVEVEPQIKVNMALKTYSRKRKSADPPETSPEKKAAISAASPMASPTTPAKIDCPVTTAAYVTKSSRVIKKKVIWDPDDELPSVVARTSTKTMSKNEPPPEQTKSPTKPMKTYEKNEKHPPPDKAALDTTAVQEKKIGKTFVKEKAEKKEDPKEDKNNKDKPKSREKSVEKQKPVEKPKLSPKKTPTQGGQVKKTPKSLKTKKSMSEVDKLLGDEGAIRMLYEIKNDGGDGTEEKRKSARNIISVEKTFKELAKKANEIKSSLVNSTNNEASPPKSLRKKDTSSPAPPPPPQVEKTERKTPTTPTAAPVLNRQKSKDSTRSSLHTPPASPAPSFEASYLIRRRSSSSISDLQDDDFDDQHDSDVEINIPRKKTASLLSDRPKLKKQKKHPSKEVVNSTVEHEEEISPAKVAKLENRLGPLTKLSVKKVNKQVTVTLELESTRGYLTIEVLEELTNALTKMSKERDCNVVLVRSSQEKTFCLGLDYASLIAEKDGDRKSKASKLADGVSDFLKSLLHFPKVLVAGIQGECVNLGVSILPLFDLVVASDKASFTANYTSLGCVAEAGFLLTAPHVTNHGLAAELLYSNHKLTADEAHRRGLVSKLCWPEKYQETIKNLLAAIAKGSKQSLEATKKQLRKSVIKSTEVAIDSLSKQLTDHWSSNECQKNFEKLCKPAE